MRLRIFLFFCVVGLGFVVVSGGAAILGYRQAGTPEAFSAFVTSGLVGVFGGLALVTFIWRLFDEHIGRPIDGLAADFRLRAQAASARSIDAGAARYLGDLGPAAAALHRSSQAEAQDEATADRIDGLERQRAQFLRILSDIPVAVMIATPSHQLVLYDGQAADILERVSPPRLMASLYDYFEPQTLDAALDRVPTAREGLCAISITSRAGHLYTGHLRRFDAPAGYALMLTPLAPSAARPLVYDFDLFDRAPSDAVEATALRDLTFVVFDSETTGLDPARDEVVQLGAVRVVNGRVIPSERFETLVNPGRSIPAASTKVHGIDDTMVADAPALLEVCAAFHGFADGAVLLAHNAPFDMAFLRRAGDAAGLRFDHAVLDTVHLSAIVFGGAAEHTLDAICDRLDIEVRADLRHTAMGDAIATAQAFAAMLPVLEARGLGTYGAVRAEAQKHARILKLEG
ncbi:3'-5' exonuclease [Jannaschia pagri]|uniref:3'-5' exonuclease n=1 Tax=Jannaschia pagri TaxID=2829797 RepID=UPI00210522EF|nr:3'-5' exonuclease [Jannaschia sp. AI_62]